jgi:hypothetical protein
MTGNGVRVNHCSQIRMKRIGLEIAILGAGTVVVGSAVISDMLFNAGIALPIGIALLVVAFMMGLTHMPFATSKPLWRKVTTGAEFAAAVVAVLFLVGVICF